MSAKTPRTDAEAWEDPRSGGQVVSADLARTLEVEIQKLTKKLETSKKVKLMLAGIIKQNEN